MKRSQIRTRPRHGVLMLVVLCILMLFTLMALTYLMVATQYAEGARSIATVERSGDDPRSELDEAFRQLLRDTLNPNSAIQGHSLLADLYGNDGVQGTINTAAYAGDNYQATGGQFFDLHLSSNVSLDPSYGFYNGRVFTVTSGDASGSTARVVGYNSDSGNPILRVMFLHNINHKPVTRQDLLGKQFVLNGRPFSGDGVDTPTVNADPQTDDVDEGYDAADYQNVFLAAIDPQESDPDQSSTNLDSDEPRYNRVNPSFHRRALIDSSPDQNAPQVTLRPTNESFRMNNLAFDPVDGPWDVDNDSDGVPDSIWIDAGLPVKTTRDGRPYKPLVAILCTDLDGRLNLNAHSNVAQAEISGLYTPLNEVTLSDGSNKTTQDKPRGQGYGPPEIALDYVFIKPLDTDPNRFATDPNNFTAAKNTLKRLLQGGGYDVRQIKGRYIKGRYGKNLRVPSSTAVVDEDYDRKALLQFHDLPKNYWNTTNNNLLTSFNSPPDLLGMSAFVLNAFGQPNYKTPADTNESLRKNSEYENDFSVSAPRGEVGNSASATLFSAAEMEALLRYYDSDFSQLPSRVIDLLDPNDPNIPIATKRNLLTTDQYDLPVPTAYNLFSLLTTKDTTQIKRMLSPDLLLGLRMDINRPLGNGLDDNNNKIVDEPSEAQAEFAFAGVRFDHNNDGIKDDHDMLARQDLARHLYVLLMALRKNEIDFQGQLFPGDQHPLTTAEGLAQWAINAVDFRDADSIMTPFEFDKTPLDGWKVDGDISTDEGNDRGLVWGCERPELLITETLAFHDRKTTDEENDNGVDDATPDDPNFDQKFRPESACFIELYNPWKGDARVPGELYYDHNGDPGAEQWSTGVILNKRVPVDDPDAVASAAPVWRLVIVAGDEKYKDPDHPSDPLSRVDIERSIYFVTPVPVEVQHGKKVYTSTEPVHHIEPGTFAVIGSSSGPPTADEYTTFIGDYSGSDPNSRNRIVLNPNLSPSLIAPNDTVQVHPSTANDSVSYSARHRPTAVVINSPSLSISEPTDGYAPIDPDNPADTPFDTDANRDDLRDENDLGQNVLMQDGTIDNFRTVHLQRLANPLQPYDPTRNPYRTIDSAFINLTVFNGETSDPDPLYPDRHTVSDRFVTVQRGDDFVDNNPNPTSPNELWRSEVRRVWEGSISVPGDGQGVPNYGRNKTNTDHVFPYNLQHTLGFLNRNYGPSLPGSEAPAPPGLPFPWLTWLNRPYVSQYELMQVPKTSSSRLLATFTLANDTDNLYDHGLSDKPFNHLLNFFDRQTELFRIFECTHVPSHFKGTSMQLSAGTFKATGDSQTPGTETPGTESFHPPFHTVSTYREPGRININTIYSPAVWNGILFSHVDPVTGNPILHDLPDFETLRQIRRGSGKLTNRLLFSDKTISTFFANPFKTPGLLSSTSADNFGNKFAIDDTILRRALNITSSQPTDAAVPQQNYQRDNRLLMMYNYQQQDAPAIEENNPNYTQQEVYRNSYLFYQNVQRLANLVTNRSNVFAIWITVGYFELDAQDPDAQGNAQLGLELGMETGEVKRHRAFYMVDRTIPVAFQPGKNHNVDRAVILRRYLE